MFILLAGLPGVGKSTLAHALAVQLDAVVLDRDQIRDGIFPVEYLDYSEEQNELASQATYLVAEYIAARNPQQAIILDGRPFSRKSQIDVVAKLAEKVGHELKVLYLWAPDDVVAERLQHDLSVQKNYAANRTVAKYYRIKQLFEPIEIEHLDLDTRLPLKELVKTVKAYLWAP